MRDFLQQLWLLLEEIFGGEKYIQDNPMPEPTPQPVLPPKKATIENFCLGIKQREGANPANNNPGNVKYYTGGYLSIYGKVGKSKGGFAMFKDYATGWLYLRNLVKSKIKKHPDWNFYDFFNNYAPREDDNEPTGYAEQVAKRCGVKASDKVSLIL